MSWRPPWVRAVGRVPVAPVARWRRTLRCFGAPGEGSSSCANDLGGDPAALQPQHPAGEGRLLLAVRDEEDRPVGGGAQGGPRQLASLRGTTPNGSRLSSRRARA